MFIPSVARRQAINCRETIKQAEVVARRWKDCNVTRLYRDKRKKERFTFRRKSTNATPTPSRDMHQLLPLLAGGFRCEPIWWHKGLDWLTVAHARGNVGVRHTMKP